jgi:hypothetical protein
MLKLSNAGRVYYQYLESSRPGTPCQMGTVDPQAIATIADLIGRHSNLRRIRILERIFSGLRYKFDVILLALINLLALEFCGFSEHWGKEVWLTSSSVADRLVWATHRHSSEVTENLAIDNWYDYFSNPVSVQFMQWGKPFDVIEPADLGAKEPTSARLDGFKLLVIQPQPGVISYQSDRKNREEMLSWQRQRFRPRKRELVNYKESATPPAKRQRRHHDRRLHHKI